MTDRAVSTPLGYVLALAITTVLVSGLLVAGGNFVSDHREQVVRQELRVTGQHLAANVEAADRLVVAGDDVEAVEVNQSFPERVTGATYRVELDGGSDQQLVLNSTRPSVSVEIELDTTTDLADSSADGGDVAVVYDEANDELVVRNG